MTHFAREYGGALFALARKDGLLEEFAEQLKLINRLFDENPAYLKLLAARSIEASDRKALMEKALSDANRYIVNFLKILIDRGAILRFPECYDVFKAMYNEMCGVEEAKVVSATELDAQQRAALQEKLEKMTGKRVEPVYSVDESLIGGLRVDVAGRRYDNTISARLADMRRTLVGK